MPGVLILEAMAQVGAVAHFVPCRSTPARPPTSAVSRTPGSSPR